ncbi:uncharacterized protein WM294_017143, partial [Sarcoramphus papa]
MGRGSDGARPAWGVASAGGRGLCGRGLAASPPLGVQIIPMEGGGGVVWCAGGDGGGAGGGGGGHGRGPGGGPGAGRAGGEPAPAGAADRGGGQSPAVAAGGRGPPRGGGSGGAGGPQPTAPRLAGRLRPPLRGVDICGVEAVRGPDGREHILQVLGSWLPLVGPGAAEDRGRIVELVLRRMRAELPRPRSPSPARPRPQ